MRVGSIVFATDQGLGILAKSFYDAGVLTDVLVLRHGRRTEHDDWFPGCTRVGDVRRLRDYMDWFLSLDALLCFETPFDWELFNLLRGKVRTVLCPMHECMPAVLPSYPDVMVCPSLLDLQWAQRAFDGSRHVDCRFIPVPVGVLCRRRERAEVFVHNAGNGGLRGRNGTKELIEAFNYVESPIKFILRSQERLNVIPFDEVDSGGNDGVRWGGTGRIGNVRLIYWGGTAPADTLWTEGDVFVFPEKFNGLSLPLQEARAAGMLVMSTDRFPMNTWLPREPLIPVSDTRRTRIAPHLAEYDEAVVDPRDIARKIDEWYGKDISGYSEQGRLWAMENSWEKLKPLYMNVLSGGR